MMWSYRSNFKEYIEGLIEQKKALGRSYDGNQRWLKQFDAFCIDTFPLETELSKRIVLLWAEKRESESFEMFRQRIIPVRELARYMNRAGLEAYVLPSNMVKTGNRPLPHLFTQMELTSLFAVSDNVTKRGLSVRHLVLPVIFRLIYCCGLRPGEARRLMINHVDLADGRLKIVESKGHKDRDVMLAPDVAEMCRQYHEKVRISLPESTYFFPNPDGSLYSREWMTQAFSALCKGASISTRSGKHPRPYDLRHTFVTNRLWQWMEDGKDIAACLPYLSAYLGHTKLSDTAYYIHLVPDLFPLIRKLNLSQYGTLIPELR